MKPHAGRNGTFSAVSGLRSAAPALLFLFGSLLAALWLLSSPAQAESLPEVLQEAERGRTLERVEEVTAPVTGVLGGVHQRVEQGATEVTASATALPGPPGTEVHDEVRGAVTELDRTREDLTEHEPIIAAGVTESTGPAVEPLATADSSSSDRARSKDVGIPEPVTTTPLRGHPQADRTDVVEATENVGDTGSTEPTIDRPRVQPATSSSSATASAPAPATAVAGYLDSPALPGPKAADAPVRVQRPHATPVDPADDPTVSPD